MTVRATRLFDLAERLRATTETTVEELASALGVSARTVRRDLALLRERGMPITAESGRGGGIRLEGARGVVAVHLGIPEIVALWLGARLAQAVADVPWTRRARGALTKLLASLPAAGARELRDLCGRIFIGPDASARVREGVGPVAPELFHLFETAVRGGTCLAFRYRDRDGRRTLREVEPHGLAITPPVWYLLGRDVDSGQPRMFRMDRISEPLPRPRLLFRADRKLVEALLPPEVTWEPLLGFTRAAAS